MSENYAYRDGYDDAYDSMYEERRELEKKIEQQEDFIRRLMGELRQHGWGDMHYRPQEQDASIRLLLEEGEIYERRTDESGARPQETGQEPTPNQPDN